MNWIFMVEIPPDEMKLIVNDIGDNHDESTCVWQKLIPNDKFTDETEIRVTLIKEGL